MLLASAAWAHAFLDHAEPKVGEVVTVSPKVIKAWFTQKLVIAFSSLEVFDGQGAEVDLKDKKLDSADQELMTVSVPELKPGKYKVVWKAVSVDTHVTHGTYSFEVK